MIWLTWRQHRTQAAAGIAALAAIGAVLLVTGLHAAAIVRASGLAGCVHSSTGDCTDLVDTLQQRLNPTLVLAVLLMAGPLLMGWFWGAPLIARETEHGTHRMVWTQGITRNRWIGSQLGFMTAITLLASAVLATSTAWWAGPANQAGLRFSPTVFDVQGIVPLGYGLFALALGAAAGAVTRRVIPAMAATLAGFAGARYAIMALARPHYLSPLTRTYPAVGPGQPSPLSRDWVLKSGYTDRLGHFSTSLRIHGCAIGSGPQCVLRQVRALGIRGYDLYQPASRYWLFQGIETAIFAGLALALFAVAVWWVRRRLT